MAMEWRRNGFFFLLALMKGIFHFLFIWNSWTHKKASPKKFNSFEFLCCINFRHLNVTKQSLRQHANAANIHLLFIYQPCVCVCLLITMTRIFIAEICMKCLITVMLFYYILIHNNTCSINLEFMNVCQTKSFLREKFLFPLFRHEIVTCEV